MIDLKTNYNLSHCRDGLFMAKWEPHDVVSLKERVLRSFLYFLLLCYIFIGIAMTTNQLMNGIEYLTSEEKSVIFKKKDGHKRVINRQKWNKTLATLTLMAIGPGLPEIMVAIIELFQKNFEAGELGPGVSIGSAAYNLFFVMAFSIVIVPTNEVRRIRHIRVVVTAAIMAFLGYFWIYIIVNVLTPNVIDIWEAFVIILLYPAFIIWSFIADRYLCCYKYHDPLYRSERYDIVNDEELAKGFTERSEFFSTVEEIREFDDKRREYINLIKEYQKKKPNENLEVIQALAIRHLMHTGDKSRAFYRLLANRELIGDTALNSKQYGKKENEPIPSLHQGVKPTITTSVFFEKNFYSISESTGEFEITVIRIGDLSKITTVEYETVNGTALANIDFVYAKGLVQFPPGLEIQQIKLEIIDDDIYKPDSVFYVKLENPSPPCVLEVPNVTSINILDDDHNGMFSFISNELETSEAVKTYSAKVIRYSGARGTVIVPYWTENGTAEDGKQYQGIQDELVFLNDETENYITVSLLHEGDYDKEVSFYIELGQPYIDQNSPLAYEMNIILAKPEADRSPEEMLRLLGLPTLGEHPRAEVKIRESLSFRHVVDIPGSTTVAKLAVISRWKEALFDTYAPTPIGEEFEKANTEIYKRGVITWYATLAHFLNLMWNVVLIIVPPAGVWHGIPTMLMCFFLLIMETTLLCDIAMHLACTMGIKEGIVSMLILSVGLNFPEMLASKYATISDEYADTAITNILGSNATQVYIGLGLTYCTATVYHIAEGTSYTIAHDSIARTSLFYCFGGFLTYILLLFRRRNSKIDAELGGPTLSKWITSGILIFIWILYIIITSLQIYGLLDII